MNSTHVAAAGITSMLADVLMYLTHWPLGPLTADTATSLAGLIVAMTGGAVKFYQHKFGNGNGETKTNGNGTPKTNGNGAIPLTIHQPA